MLTSSDPFGAKPDYNRLPVRHPAAKALLVGEEVVLHDPSDNLPRHLDPVGSRIWELADGRHTVQDIARQLTREFEMNLVTARLCAITFIETLVDRQMLDWR